VSVKTQLDLDNTIYVSTLDRSFASSQQLKYAHWRRQCSSRIL